MSSKEKVRITIVTLEDMGDGLFSILENGHSTCDLASMPVFETIRDGLMISDRTREIVSDDRRFCLIVEKVDTGTLGVSPDRKQ